MTEQRAIGSTGLSTPPLVLGGNVFGWTADRDASFAIMDAFLAGGGRMIDTADAYSAFVPGHVGGESEAVMGEWIKARGKRDDVLIATKVGLLPGEGGKGLAPSRIVKAVEESLARLQTDYIDLYYAHRDDNEDNQEAVAETFDALIRSGKVRAIAASNFSQERLASALAISDRKGLARYGAYQAFFNLLERPGFDAAFQRFCVEEKIGVLPYFGLGSGFLTGKYRSREDLKGKLRKHFIVGHMNERGLAILAVLDAVAEETGAKQAQVALAWLMAQPGVVAPLASATNLAQLDELLGAMRLTLSTDQVARLDEASRMPMPEPA